jgi:hypothetical protein
MTLSKLEKAKRQLRPRVARFQNPSTGPTDLFRIYDAEGVLLKMNISASAGKRFAQWKRTTTWCPKTARMTLEHFPTRAAAQRALELAAEKEHPLREIYNFKLKDNS